MSKIGLRVPIKGIKANLHLSHRKFIGQVPAVWFTYPPCELFDNVNDIQVLTLFDENKIYTQLMDGRSQRQIYTGDISDTTYIFDAIVEHNIYGTMKASMIIFTSQVS